MSEIVRMVAGATMHSLAHSIHCVSIFAFPTVISESVDAVPAEVQRLPVPPPALDAKRRDSSPWPDIDKVVAELRDWLMLLERMLRSQTVTVGDLEEIENMIIKQKVSL